MLGLDTNGHGNRPYSKQYLENIKIVDKGLKDVEKLIERYYNDNSTSFIITSDHGMSNRGSHGDGDPQNTQTPIIAWGAGVSKPNKEGPLNHDEQSTSWGLTTLQRNDINQADVTPLMATLIGVPFPVNSVGELHTEYLDGTTKFKAEAKFANALEIIAQYTKKEQVKESSEFVFHRFPGLVDLKARVEEIRHDLDSENFATAEVKSSKLISLAIQGLRYYQTYDWLLLRTIVSAGYLGWIVYSLVFVYKCYNLNLNSSSVIFPRGKFLIGSIFIFVLGSLLLYHKKAPASYYAYWYFPVLFWTKITENQRLIRTSLDSALSLRNRSALVQTLIYIGVLEFLV